MDNDILLLQNISNTLKDQPQASQRTLARNADVSLGMMNAILGRFVERGWVMLNNVNARKLAYVLTPAGMAELKSRSKQFAKRTFAMANEYNQLLCDLIKKEKSKGKNTVVLYGDSYIKFLLEYACHHEGVGFEQKDVDGADLSAGDVLPVVGEMVDDDVQKKIIAAGGFGLLDVMER